MIEPPSSAKWWAPIIHFATHAVVGTAVFVVVALPAVLVHWLVHALAAAGIDGYVAIVLTGLEYSLVTVDATALLSYLGITLYKAIKGWWE